MHTKQENQKTAKIDEIFLYHLDTEELHDFTPLQSRFLQRKINFVAVVRSKV